MEMNTCNPPEFFRGSDDIFWVDEAPRPADAGADEPTYSIGDLAGKFDVSLRALRFYESRGLLRPARDGRRRRYGRKDADRLNVILKAKKLGFTLGEIHQMIAAEGDAASRHALRLSREKCLEQIGVFERKLADVQEALAELRFIYSSLTARIVDTKLGGDETT
jgi:DNA-binding transcriptional MerR regulator